MVIVAPPEPASADDRTRAYWATNLAVDRDGSRRLRNFWDMPLALGEYRRSAFRDLPSAGHEQPAMSLLRSRVGPGVLKRGLSIGCGTGGKELALVKAGLVDHVTLIDLVPELIEAARAGFRAEGLEHRADFIVGHYRDRDLPAFDLIYFDNALHHINGVDDVLRFCVDRLSTGGWFVMDDFVGPTFNQFDEELYRYADAVRRMLPAGAFVGPDAIADRLGRIPVQAYLDSDPSEACDSAAILPAIARLMPGAAVTPTGGLVPYLACRDAFQTFDPLSDEAACAIRLLFELDRVLVCANPAITCYALACWRKPAADVAPVPVADWQDLIVWPDWGIPIPPAGGATRPA